MHRRRGWVWATVISVVAFLVACGLLGARAPNGSGAGIAVASVFILLLGAVAVVGLVASITDTVRLHRLDPGVRARRPPTATWEPREAPPTGSQCSSCSPCTMRCGSGGGIDSRRAPAS
jgi:hypothetical protein